MTFHNLPYIDFTVPAEVKKFGEFLERTKTQLYAKPVKVPIIIDGQEIYATGAEDLDPSSKTKIADISFATESQAEQALQILQSGTSSWASYSASKRAEIIARAGELMTEKRHELAAIIVLEAGKPWKEADADLAEAVDFCYYYAEQYIQLAEVKETDRVLGEHSVYFYQPRGVVTVIAPWNFPLAIACGMTVAALVTGNTVALKPAEQTSLIAYELAKILYAAGVPSNALAFLPGLGETVGNTLVCSALTDMICFTGSRQVGLQIIQNAAFVQPKQKSIKKVIAELGGKNAIIIDESADLDEAIKGVLYSAYGFSGQKCSACSRVLVVGSAYENFIKRFKDAANDIILGSAHDPGIYLGPVIDVDTQQRLLNQIERAKKEFTCIVSAIAPNQNGYFVPVHAFTEVPFDSWLWKEELFGPVLAINHSATFTAAIQEANNSEYALTGGVYTRSPANIELATNEFKVGNLYINRGCTGAIVKRHPFGGFKMSGVGSKAGGPDYLLQFVEPRTVTENTVRRGFTPEMQS